MRAFLEQALAAQETGHFKLLVNNAGIAGGGSFVTDDRADWDKTFCVCWTRVYNCRRAFLPLVINSSEGHVVNISSVNGFWACINPVFPHTASQAAEIILQGVRARRWHILVGEDAQTLDARVRQEPKNAYSTDFFARMQANGVFNQTSI